MARCRFCSRWHIRPDDKFCALCGRDIRQFRVLNGTHRILLENGVEYRTAEVWLQNTGQGNLHVSIKAPAAPAYLEFQGLPMEDRLSPGDTVTLSFQYRLVREMPEPYYELPIQADSQILKESILFYRASSPLVKAELIHPRGQRLTPAQLNEPATLYLYNDGGAACELTLRQNPDWLSFFPPPASEPLLIGNPVDALGGNRPPFPLQLPPYSRREIQVRIDPRERVLDGHILLSCSSGERPMEEIDVPVIMAVARPAQPKLLLRQRSGQDLEITELALGQISPSERRREVLLVKNTGEESLHLKSIHTSDSVESQGFLLLPQSGQKEIPPEEEIAFTLIVDALHLEGHNQQHRKRILFLFQEGIQFELPVNFYLQDMAPYSGLVAIDFGTTNSCLAKVDGDDAPVEPIALENNEWVPSIIYFPSADDYLTGWQARKYADAYPQYVVRSIKRNLLTESLKFHGREFDPEELVAFIIRDLITLAEKNLSRRVRRIALTVPVDFSDSQRKVVEHAARRFVEEAIVLDEPTAAAMNYIENHPEIVRNQAPNESFNLVVFDFGGGTLDISVLKVSMDLIEIVSRRGNSRLGGIDMDAELAKDFAKGVQFQFPEFEAQSILLNRKEFDARYSGLLYVYSRFIEMRENFRNKAEETKKDLSKWRKVDISINKLLRHDGSMIDRIYSAPVERSQFEALIRTRVENAITTLREALTLAGIERNQVHIVLLTGQICRIPYIREQVRQFFDQCPVKIPELESFDPKLCVSMGAARLALLELNTSRTFVKNARASWERIGFTRTKDIAGTLEFTCLLESNHPYGQRGTMESAHTLSDRGELNLTLRKNPWKENLFQRHQAQLPAVADIHFRRPELGGATIRLQLGLDENGMLQAFIDNQECPLEHAIETLEEIW